MYRKKIRKRSSSRLTSDKIVNNYVLNHRQIDDSVRDSIFGSNKNKGNKLLYVSESSDQDDTNIISTRFPKNQNMLNKKNKNANSININTELTARDLEVMKIFTSQRWSKKSFSKSIVNMQIDKKETHTNEEIENSTTDKIDHKKSSETTHQEKYSSSEYEEISTSTDMNARESYDSLLIKDEHDLENNLESLNENIRVLSDEQELENNQENLNDNVRKEFSEVLRDEQTLENNESLNENVEKSEKLSNARRHKQDLENIQEISNENVNKSGKLFEILRDEQDLEITLESLNESTRKSRESFEVFSSSEINKSFENMSFEVSLKSMEAAKKSESIIFNKEFEYLRPDAEKIFKTSKNINNIMEYGNQNNFEEETYSYEYNI